MAGPEHQDHYHHSSEFEVLAIYAGPEPCCEDEICTPQDVWMERLRRDVAAQRAQRAQRTQRTGRAGRIYSKRSSRLATPKPALTLLPTVEKPSKTVDSKALKGTCGFARPFLKLAGTVKRRGGMAVLALGIMEVERACRMLQDAPGDIDFDDYIRQLESSIEQLRRL